MNTNEDKCKTYESMADRFLSLFRFNITFKLTLEFTLTFITFMILINIIFYVGIKSWMYTQNIDILRQASQYIEVNDSDTILSPEILEFEGIQYFLFTENTEKLIESNTDEIISYSAYKNSNTPLNFFTRNKPDYYYYKKTISKNNEMMILVMRKNALESHREIDFLWSMMIGLSIILTSLVWISSSRISHRHLKPIKNMTKKVQDISVNNLDTRIDIRGTKDELKDLAYTFNEMMDEIENSYEKQKQFVSDASHELRTPIAVIKGYASMVNRWGKEDQSVLEESLKAIEEEARNMQSLVESLLFLARRDKGTFEMEKERFNAKDFINEIIKESSLIDNKHRINGTIEYEGDIYASPDKLKQAMRVFIDNSMKYTPDDGEIHVTLKASQKDVYFVISDSGIGISQEDLPRIFERFYRADEARTRNKKSSTGLGLAIAKIIIEQHQGKIMIESELEKGTSITVILPKNI